MSEAPTLERLDADFAREVEGNQLRLRGSLRANYGKGSLGWLKSPPAPAFPTRAICRVGSDAFMASRCLGSPPDPNESAGSARTVVLFFLNRGARRGP